MKHLRLCAPALVISPLLLALAPRAESVSFHPDDGSSLSKDFEISLQISIGDVSLFADGQDVSGQVPDDLALALDVEVSITDEYVKTVDGKPLDLIRTFETLSAAWEGGAGGESDSGEVEEFADLEDLRVRFEWNEKDGDYRISYHESEGDEELLQGLGIDMDMRALLPAGDVEVGDQWEVRGKALSSVFAFGSNLESMQAPDEIVAQIIEEEILPQLTAMAEEFTFTCEFKGSRELEGTPVSAIGLTLSGEGQMDIAGIIESALNAQVPDGMEFELSISNAELAVLMQGKGELLWDQKLGAFRSMEMDSDLELIIDIEIDIDAGGQSQSMEAEIELLGEGSWRANAKP
jgi:hypothetical protein